MVRMWLRCDIRSPVFGTDTQRLCAIAIEQAAWADRHGFDAVQLPEHHGSPDGYNPSPLLLASAIAARTTRLRMHVVLLLPLHDPIRIAEDVAVLDNISDGRAELTVGLGYLPSEFAMFGVALRDRAALVDAKLLALRRALAGERFDYEGRQVHVTPRPVQQPTPPLFVGGGVPAAARRAARLGDGFAPSFLDPALREAYADACREQGKAPGEILDFAVGPQFVFVTEDPESAWQAVAPHALYETNAYARWSRESTGVTMPFTDVTDIAGLKESGIYRVVTPDQCVELAKALEKEGQIMTFNAMLAGLPERLSWSSLELFAAKVLPPLQSGQATAR